MKTIELGMPGIMQNTQHAGMLMASLTLCESNCFQ